MQKPTMQTQEAYDYNECTKYIEEKYGIDTRDFAGRFNKKDGKLSFDKTKPYEDFWHFILDNTDINNGSYFYLSEDWAEDFDDDDFRKIIMHYYMEEFGEGYGEIYFWVAW